MAMIPAILAIIVATFSIQAAAMCVCDSGQTHEPERQIKKFPPHYGNVGSVWMQVESLNIRFG